MSLASMTGFARATASVGTATLCWELKTVHAKGLDIRLRTPPGFDGQESGFRARIGAAIARGTCHAGLTLSRAARKPEVRVDVSLLRSLAEKLASAVPPGLGIGPPTLDGLIGIRGVVDIVEPEDDPAEHAVLLTEADRLLLHALAELTAMRKQEGEGLAGLLAGHLDHIGANTVKAEQAPGRSPEMIRDRLRRSVAQLSDAAGLDPQRLHQEALLLAAKSDIREELDRLALHRQSAAELLRAGGPVGRRLDFLAQELGREANTLCAKSNDAALTQIGMDLRNRIEQFREQVQNLE